MKNYRCLIKSSDTHVTFFTFQVYKLNTLIDCETFGIPNSGFIELEKYETVRDNILYEMSTKHNINTKHINLVLTNTFTCKI